MEIEKMGRWAVEFAQFSLKLFDDIVLGNQAYVDLILGDIYTHRTHYIGMVDENNKVNFYDGKISVVDPDGMRLGKYAPKEYTEWIAEHVEPWTYLKFPYLKKVGWKGFVDGKEFGRLLRHTALPPERFRRHGHPPGAGRIREVLQYPGRQTRPPAPCHALGAPGGAALCR